jgi:8-oxo-dGTP pyrophosphatase MutT (NUDIX family)
MNVSSVRDELAIVIAGYQKLHGSESTGALCDQLSAHQDVFSRSNMLGHVTTSALAIDVDRQEALLIHHNVFQRWMQPGGHYELCEQLTCLPVNQPSWLIASAFREVTEETGLELASAIRWCADWRVPFDIDTHSIVANPLKGEGFHVHHDLLYLAHGNAHKTLKPHLSEVSSARWVPLAQLPTLSTRMLRIYDRLLKCGIALQAP